MSEHPAAEAPAKNEQEDQQPMVTIVSGQPSAEELAALVTVLSALVANADAEPERARSAWSDPAWRLSGPQPRRGGWRSSALPR
ncbi:MAG TPA: acyl-CoA carboxylase subunit epsilon [Dermatophilaceae bacterium]|nr:acyl-CoA carboxylase subunit epsilon [Dermatophilaceae bacterium]